MLNFNVNSFGDLLENLVLFFTDIFRFNLNGLMCRLSALLSCLTLLIFTAGCQSPNATNFPAPPFQLTSLENLNLTLDDYQGQVVVVHFGTSWCPFCRAEDPYLEALHQTYQDKDVQVLVINVGETDEAAIKWKREAGFSFPMLMDREGVVAAQYAPAEAQPDLPRHEVMIASNLVIDKAGRVRFMSLLDTNNFDAKLVALRNTLDAVLAEDSPSL